MKHPFAFFVLPVFFVICLTARTEAAGFQWARVPDSDGEAIEVAIWYPSDDVSTTKEFNLSHKTVALNGTLKGNALPLIVFSHGTGGSALSSFDLAAAIADSGFVVAAVIHPGDNYRDTSLSFTPGNFLNRPRHISRTIDFMLGAWQDRTMLDPSRIGFFGHSAGGMTGLLLIGGVADWNEVIAFCKAHPEDWGCRNAAKRRASSAAAKAAPAPIAGGDERIKTAILAAPALVHAFGQNGLAGVRVPVQLWVPEEDEIVPDAATLQDLLPGLFDFRFVPGAGHFAFLDICSAELAKRVPEICSDPKGFDRVRFHENLQAETVAFFRRTLKAPAE